MKKTASYEAPSTSRWAIVHDLESFPMKWQDRIHFSDIAKEIEEALNPQSLLVEMHHTIDDIERIFGVYGFGTSLLLGIKSLVGKTLVYHNGHIHIQESGTKFAVQSARTKNDESFALAA